MTKYIDADTLLDARNAHGMGVPLAKIASQLGISERDLRRALGLPEWRPAVDNGPVDLWAADELGDRL